MIVERQLNDKFAKFCEMIKGLHINVPFLDAIQQIPSYTKFLKDILAKKRKPSGGMIQVPYQVSAYIDKKLPKKLGDPGSFCLPVKIGDLDPRGALRILVLMLAWALVDCQDVELSTPPHKEDYPTCG